MSLLTATRLAPTALRASSTAARRLPALTHLPSPSIPHPPLSIRSLQSTALLATETRRSAPPHAAAATSAAVAAGQAHSTLMSNLAIPPTQEHGTGLKYGASTRGVHSSPPAGGWSDASPTASAGRPSRAQAGAEATEEAKTKAARGEADGNSTALRPDVRESEEGTLVVGGGRGAEGAYNVNPARDTDPTGGWTLMNPIYTDTELNSVQVVGREPVTLSDKAAHGIVKLLRRTFDLFTGYIAKPIPAEMLAKRPLPVAELRATGQLLSDKQWLLRIILLESIAGVPGMVAGTLRHLRSLRMMRRDGGWIHTLLEEAENERMHLLTFLTVSQPTIFTRALVMAAQGVFYNLFFLTYLFTPKTAHRFVGALEEEAVRTYTHCIEDVSSGLVPEWENKPAPQIAIDYWRMAPDATLLDVIKAVRADEATHRFVNHSLANLDQKHDFNPFALAEASPEVRGSQPGFTREESAEFARQTQRKLLGSERVETVEPPKQEKPKI